MTPLEYTLAAYAKLFIRNMPKSFTDEVPELRPLELKIAELCGDTDWYCDVPPFDSKSVIFFWWAEPAGMTSQCIVDTNSGSVNWYGKKPQL